MVSTPQRGPSGTAVWPLPGAAMITSVKLMPLFGSEVLVQLSQRIATPDGTGQVRIFVLTLHDSFVADAAAATSLHVVPSATAGASLPAATVVRYSEVHSFPHGITDTASIGSPGRILQTPTQKRARDYGTQWNARPRHASSSCNL